MSFTPDPDTGKAFTAWLASIGRDPMLAHREDPEDIFAAGYRAGQQATSHDRDALIEAARRVVSTWDKGDLAGEVSQLADLIESMS